MFAVGGPQTKWTDIPNQNYRLCITLYDGGSYISMTSLLSNTNYTYSYIRVDVQCIKYYSDGSFDRGYGLGNLEYSLQTNSITYVYYYINKTIDHIDTDSHIYLNGSYYDTIPCAFFYPLTTSTTQIINGY